MCLAASHTELAPLPGSRHNRPSGGGIGQFLKESLTGIVTPNEGEDSRSSEAPSQSRSEAAPAKLAPLPGSQHAQPSGGGVGQLLNESVTGKVTPNAGEDTAAEAEGQAEGSKGEGAAAAASPPDLSALLPSDDAVVYGGEQQVAGPRCDLSSQASALFPILAGQGHPVPPQLQRHANWRFEAFKLS